MRFDHRRILATAIARLRAKLKYRPVVFELMPREFTLTELQRTVEAISGRHLHKQNFRRLVETAALVEPTGETSTATGGRPAALFRFRREVVQERPAPGCASAAGRSAVRLIAFVDPVPATKVRVVAQPCIRCSAYRSALTLPA